MNIKCISIENLDHEILTRICSNLDAKNILAFSACSKLIFRDREYYFSDNNEALHQLYHLMPETHTTYYSKIFASNRYIVTNLNMNKTEPGDRKWNLVENFQNLRIIKNIPFNVRYADLAVISTACTHIELSCVENLSPEEIIQFLKGHTQLTSISIKGYQNVTNEIIETIATCFPNLKEIDLSFTNITDDDLINLTTKCQQLRKINLSYCDKISNTGMRFLAENCKGLTRLNISWTYHINDQAIASIAMSCPLIKKLYLTRCCSLTDHTFTNITRYCQNLVALSIQGCGFITDTGIEKLADLRQPLKRLHLNGCHSISEKCLRNLTELLPKTKIITSDSENDIPL